MTEHGGGAASVSRRPGEVVVQDLTGVAKHFTEEHGADEQPQAEGSDPADLRPHVEEEGVLQRQDHPAHGEEELADGAKGGATRLHVAAEYGLGL